MRRSKEMTERRDRDIYALFKQLTLSGGYSTAEQVIRTIASVPAPCPYLDPRTLAKRMAHLRAGRTIEDGDATSGRYYYLYWKWLGMRDVSEGMEKDCELLAAVPVPSYYLSPSRIKAIVLRERRKEREALYGKAHQ